MKFQLSTLLFVLCLIYSCSTSKKVVDNATTAANSKAVAVADTTKKDMKKDKSKKPKKPKEKKYTDIITDEAVSDTGLFVVHHIEDKYYYEIPDELLNTDMLLVTRIAKIPANMSPFLNAGSKTNEQVVHWVKKGKKVMLKQISFNAIAPDSLPIYESVKNNNLEPILRSFKVECLGKDSTGVVIDATSLFTEDITSISGLNAGQRRTFKANRLDKSRSYIDTIRSYPINIEAVHTMTFSAGSPPSGRNSGTITMQMNQSMILLPEDKMTSRLYDPRVGWFSLRQIDYGSDKLKSDQKTYIRKWRLVPKDKAAYMRGELVEPIKPIVYYLDPATPEQWRPYFIKGIEDWNEAFEKAGFKNAIMAKAAPENDPDFSPEDARYSTVRYVASTTRNAVGPSVSDPRTGEILESDIIWYHNHLRSYRNRYLLETGAANPKARTLLTPEEEIGEMMRRVISHEIGHALGLPHNMKASSAYPVDSLRSGTFTQKYGIATTIMDYARYNYIAQPGDENIRFIRQLGPYDMYSIEYGYRWYPDVEKPEDEKSILHAFVSKHSEDPMYQFGGGFPRTDPDSQTENIGDDPVRASDYGLRNLKIVSGNLIEWTSTDGQSYGDLSELYGEMVGVYSRYIGHVATMIGGVNETLRTTDQDGDIYSPLHRTDQKRSMNWLLNNAFATPTWLMREDIIKRITSEGALDRIRSIQSRHLSTVLNANRMQRLVEASYMDPEKAYPLTEMIDDLQKGLFSEAYSRSSVDVVRRALQRTYLTRVNSLLNPAPSTGSRFFFGPPPVNVSNTDIQPVLKMKMKELHTDLKKAAKRQKDAMTKAHFEDCIDRIEDILDADK